MLDGMKRYRMYDSCMYIDKETHTIQYKPPSMEEHEEGEWIKVEDLERKEKHNVKMEKI